MKLRGATVVLTLTFLTLWGMTFATEAHAATGSISGTVTDAASHSGVADIQVYASLVDQGGPPLGDAVTATDGTYVMSGLAPGEYTVWFNDQDGADNGDHADEYYDDNVSQDFSDPIIVGDGASVTGIDAALSGCGTIYGWVEGDGSRRLNAWVQAYCWIPAKQAWENYPLEFQDVDPVGGEYVLERVRAGQWALRFSDHGDEAGTYAAEYHPDAHFVWDAQTVLVTPGSSVFVKGDLDLGATIRGHVYDSSGGPLEGGIVVWYDWDPDALEWIRGGETPVFEEGRWGMDGFDTWTYRFQFYPPEGSLLADEYWDNSAELAGGTSITFGVGQILEGYDVWLGTNESVAPVTSLSGLPASGWSRLPLTLTLTANDAGSGVEVTQYRLDGGLWTEGTAIDVPAPSTHVSDGLHTIDYRSADFRGNWEQARSSELQIDTLGPRTSALAGVSVTKGARASFRYKVSDRSPSATLAIAIHRGAKLVKTLRLGARSTGRALTHRWRCTLARGRYTWMVQATDKAGNPQSKAGSRALVVN